MMPCPAEKATQFLRKFAEWGSARELFQFNPSGPVGRKSTDLAKTTEAKALLGDFSFPFASEPAVRKTGLFFLIVVLLLLAILLAVLGFILVLGVLVLLLLAILLAVLGFILVLGVLVLLRLAILRLL